MKIFGPAAERIGRLMDSLEVEPIEHPWVARSIAGAQKKVEGMHFDARKHVVEYDDVMNKQRQIVYEERRKVLEGADARTNILGYVKDIIEKGIAQHCESRHPENWDIEGLVKYLSAYLPIAPGSEIPETALEHGQEGLAEHLNAAPKKRQAAPVGAAAGSAPGPNVKLGRNDPCWCGSGKKYKRCHGK